MTDSGKMIEVLFVEDDLRLHDDPKVDTLQEKGDMKVSIARSGPEALEYLRTGLPDIVVLDIMMAPGADLPEDEVKNGYETGFALLRKMRRELKLHIPVIVLTAYPKMMSEEERRELKVAEYLSKPVKMTKLAELIRKHVKGGSRDAAR